MIKTRITITVFFSLAIMSVISNSYAEAVEAEVIMLDGREVMLDNDGSWRYLSSDRYVDTKDGTRVRLKQDGSWQAVGNTPLISKQQVRTGELDIKLNKVIIETHKKKVQKNTTIKTQTVFYLQVNYSPRTDKTLSINNADISNIEVGDNNGRRYPVLSVRPDLKQIEPNTETTLVVRAKKSPSIWDDVKSMQIVFNTGLSGIETPIILSQKVTDFENKNVDGFDKGDK